MSDLPEALQPSDESWPKGVIPELAAIQQQAAMSRNATLKDTHAAVLYRALERIEAIANRPIPGSDYVATNPEIRSVAQMALSLFEQGQS